MRGWLRSRPRRRGARRRGQRAGLLGAPVRAARAAWRASALRLSGEVAEKYLDALLRNPRKDHGLRAHRRKRRRRKSRSSRPCRTTRAPASRARPVARSASHGPTPVSLDEVKAVGKVLDCSVNDVLLVDGRGRAAALSRREGRPGRRASSCAPWCRSTCAPPRRTTTARQPLRPRDAAPAGRHRQPARAALRGARRMEALKCSYQPVIAFALLGAAGLVPRAVQQQMLDLLANKATAVMTNVPGPQEPLYLAGARLRQIMFWVPQSGDIGHGRVDPLLQRRRAVRPDHRRWPRARSGDRHRGLPARNSSACC